MKINKEFDIPREILGNSKELEDYINAKIDELIKSLDIEAVVTQDKKLLIKYSNMG